MRLPYYLALLVAVIAYLLIRDAGLIPDCDDDVMDEQKWSACSWLLLQEFVRIRREQEKEREEAIARGEVKPEELNDLPMPSVSWVMPSCPPPFMHPRSLGHSQYKARQIMTRADFLEDLDRDNIIAIDVSLPPLTLPFRPPC